MITEKDKECILSLEKRMADNAREAEDIYNEAIKNGLQNEQFFMDWQDRLNIVTFVHEEDLD